MSASCSECTPEQRIERGCEGSDELQWTDPITEDEYYVCPLKFITNHIIRFSNEYHYGVDFPGTAAKYSEQASRFIDAVAVYKSNINELTIIARGESIPDKEVKNG